jgi:hypothetical protein
VGRELWLNDEIYTGGHRGKREAQGHGRGRRRPRWCVLHALCPVSGP